MELPNVDSTVYHLTSEIRATRFETFAPLEEERFKNMSRFAVASACYDLYADASYGLRFGMQDPGHVRFAFTKKLLYGDATNMPVGDSLDHAERACFQAETRLLRCLERYESGIKDKKSSKLPSAVWFDDDGPFAYQKTDGLNTAFAWRTGVLKTHTQAYTVPAGAIFEPVFGHISMGSVAYTEDPRWDLWNDTDRTVLIAMRSVTPDNARFLRYTTHYLPASLRTYAHTRGVEVASSGRRNTSLHNYIEPAGRLSNAQLGRRVGALLKHGVTVQL
jgi:hypothetical protein